MKLFPICIHKSTLSPLNIVFSLLVGIVSYFTPLFSPVSTNKNPLVCGIFGAITFIAIIYLINLLSSRLSAASHTHSHMSNTIFFISFFVFTLLVGCLYLIVYYPGTGSTDTLYVYYGGFSVASQHPWPYILLVKLVQSFVKTLGGNQEAAFLAFSILQLCMASAIFSTCLLWLKNKHLHPTILLVIGCFYALCPIICLYNITQVKDVPYSLILTLLIPVLYDCWETQGASLSHPKTFFLLIFCSASSVLRNNGPYVIAFLLLFMFICFYKYWKRLVIVSIVFLLTMTTVNLGERHLNQKHNFRETVGVPLQQIAATVFYNGNITNEQYQIIEKIIPVNAIKELYDPFSVDALKFGKVSVSNEYLNQNKGTFLKLWYELLFPNLRIYVKSYLYALYGFWSMDNTQNIMKYDTIYRDSFKDWFILNNISYKSILPSEFQNHIECFLDKITVFAGVGTCFWLFWALTCAIVSARNLRALIIFTPVIGYWLTLMISSPIAYQWRYGLPIVYALPMIFGIAFLHSSFTNASHSE